MTDASCVSCPQGSPLPPIYSSLQIPFVATLAEGRGGEAFVVPLRAGARAHTTGTRTVQYSVQQSTGQYSTCPPHSHSLNPLVPLTGRHSSDETTQGVSPPAEDCDERDENTKMRDLCLNMPCPAHLPGPLSAAAAATVLLMPLYATGCARGDVSQLSGEGMLSKPGLAGQMVWSWRFHCSARCRTFMPPSFLGPSRTVFPAQAEDKRDALSDREGAPFSVPRWARKEEAKRTIEKRQTLHCCGVCLFCFGVSLYPHTAFPDAAEPES
jgi:hypothetical protein